MKPEWLRPDLVINSSLPISFSPFIFLSPLEGNGDRPVGRRRRIRAAEIRNGGDLLRRRGGDSSGGAHEETPDGSDARRSSRRRARDDVRRRHLRGQGNDAQEGVVAQQEPGSEGDDANPRQQRSISPYLAWDDAHDGAKA